ncbi:hypothetical protein SKAU_G00149170 [Synaphobranchus kaupii]|uniref:Uncharacterized protein n=1 Tax=Synaphobranchus kaupii TaxID=118154 RepID=A0A9Q1FTQ2_SYNKA|nr:hypothetical protein SKAU_G00149170 [Synaphobranchus kaupii]
MSTTSKVVLGISLTLTLVTVSGVHIKQNWDREKLREGVVRDLERQEAEEENLRALEEQISLTRELEAELTVVALTKAAGLRKEGGGGAGGGMDCSGELRGLSSGRDEEASEGLEEGEVEGETLLIVESEDQASVDLSHEQSGDSLNSDMGDDADSSWNEDMSFYCDKCHKWIPAAQLRGEQPSYLKGDNFFKFTCYDCSEDGKETFERMRLTWQQVVMLAMYNLSLEGTGRQGYFRWKEDICSYIGRHWTFLLGSRKKTSTWWSTVAGCLSVGSPTFFRSGAQEFGEPGWWKLVQNRPPTLRPEGEKTSIASLKAKVPSKPPLDPIITVEGLRKRAGRNPVESAMQLKEKRSRTQEAKDIRRAQKEAAGFMDRSASSSDRTPLTSPSPSPSPDFSAPGTPASHSATPSLLSEADLIPDVMPPQALFHDDDELDGEGVIDPGIELRPPLRAAQPVRGEAAVAAVGACPQALAVTPQAKRLHRKLLVRQAKRGARAPLLDLDQAVSATLTLVGGVYGAQEAGLSRQGPAGTRNLPDHQPGPPNPRPASRKGYLQSAVSFCHRLMGSDAGIDQGIRSPYTSRILKPFIRRDYESRPLKLNLLAEIRGHAHRNDPSWVPEPDAPIDYCYVRPNHIPSVNSMCHEIFWPGVDLSECLQYPDFSVVVLYKKVVIGFGFMVPDVKYKRGVYLLPAGAPRSGEERESPPS